MTINAKEFVLPLGVATPTEGERYRVDHFVGSSFFITGQGWIATCKHNLPELMDGRHYTCKYLVDDLFYELTEIRHHPKMDLAVAKVGLSGGYLTPYPDPLLLGIEVRAFGFIMRGLHNGKLTVDIRYLAGYVTRVGPNDYDFPTGPTLLEVSFPSPPGFSGTPLITDRGLLLGMMYGNLESSIEVFSISEVTTSGTEVHETAHRIMEFGLAHPLEQLEQGVRDLDTWIGRRTD